MMCYEDKSFCFSPDCKNKCGRKLTEFDRRRAAMQRLPISGQFYCGVSKIKDEEWTVREGNHNTDLIERNKPVIRLMIERMRDDNK